MTTDIMSHRRFHYRDAETLRRDIADLDLSIPWDDNIDPLLNPVNIGSRQLPNRLAVHPMEAVDAEPDGAPGELAVRRYQRYAAGGSGLIWFEATAVVPEGRANPRQFFLHEHNLAEFRRLVTATRSAANDAMGSDHDPTLVLQITHSGRWSKPDGTPRPIVAHHNRTLDEMVGIDHDHPLISDEELDQLQATFVGAAKLAAMAGFDGVDVKACHGYLCSELLAAHTRDGRYGGALENRTRFLLETSRRIREEVPEVFVTSRVNAYDGLPFPYGFGVDRESEDKPDLEEPLRLFGQLQADGFPVVNVTMGVPYRRPHIGRPFNRAVPGGPAAPEHPLVGVARFQQVTGRLQSAYPGIPLVGTGYSWLRQFFPNVGAAAVSAGRVSVVGLGRMAFAYPDFAKDLIEHGRLDSRKSCVGCSGCSELMRASIESGCIVRDSELYCLPNPR